jgi:hypothetical protein
LSSVMVSRVLVGRPALQGMHGGRPRDAGTTRKISETGVKIMTTKRDRTTYISM